MSDKVNIRIPVLEILATGNGGVFAENVRMLSKNSPADIRGIHKDSEETIAKSIFGQAINYDAVRIVSTNIINAPATLGNNIRIPPGFPLDNATLIHELTHVWQFQTKGNAYISDSAVHQIASAIGSGTRNAAYIVTIVPGQSIYRYTAEHQAMIVEDYFTNISKRPSTDYVRMIKEIRSTRPTLTDGDRYQESLYGRQYRNSHVSPVLPTSEPYGQTIPVLRLEWKFNNKF